MPSTDVVVAVVTFRRPAELARLLEALPLVQFPGRMRVLVIDNDPDGSAGAVVAQAQRQSHLRLDYVVEPAPGIAAARNRAVSESADAEFIAFIDDDEIPSPTWLGHLVDVQRRFDADLVAGPVLSLVEGGTAWVAQGGFFDRSRRPTGPGWFLASSANLLIRLSAQERLGGTLFDVGFGLTGGSDTLLSLQARRAGLRMAWADEAEVTEFVPGSRARVGWILRRAYRCGTTIALCEATVAGSGVPRLRARLTRGVKGAAHAMIACLRIVPAAVSGRRAGAVQALRRLCSGAGMMAGALGHRYVEYRRASA